MEDGAPDRAHSADRPARRLAKRIQEDPRPADQQVRDRLLAALSLYEEGLEIRRASLRREHPGASDAEIASRLSAWLADRRREAPGRRATWPRR